MLILSLVYMKKNIEIRECMALDGISYKEILALIYGYRDYYKKC